MDGKADDGDKVCITCSKHEADLIHKCATETGTSESYCDHYSSLDQQEVKQVHKALFPPSCALII